MPVGKLREWYRERWYRSMVKGSPNPPRLSEDIKTRIALMGEDKWIPIIDHVMSDSPWTEVKDIRFWFEGVLPEEVANACWPV